MLVIGSMKDLPFPKRHIFDASKLKDLAGDNFKFGENITKFTKQVENNVGIGEIARHEQFLVFPQCFQKKIKPRERVKKIKISRAVFPCQMIFTKISFSSDVQKQIKNSDY